MAEIDVDRLLLIVVGAHLRAEIADRPLGYRLHEAVQNQLHQHSGDTDWPLLPIVCTDVWVLNHDELQERPAIAIGGPGVNALSGYLYQRLPTALAIENQLVIQMDLGFDDHRVAIWGFDAGHTVSAVELFERKYLREYLRALGAL